MAVIKQLLKTKGHDIESVGANDSVYDAIKLMADKNVGSLVVLENGKLVGIVTERHYARNVFLKGRSSRETLVGDIMATHVVCASVDQTVQECMALMTDKMVRHLPVLDNNELVGIISIGDLVKNIIDGQQFIIEQLEMYISR
ncbi:histidine kinase [Rhodobacterales bacterium 52_120_T64]|nr:histidine kinase [Rhodobacterales bacterium 52_120_T64]